MEYIQYILWDFGIPQVWPHGPLLLIMSAELIPNCGTWITPEILIALSMLSLTLVKDPAEVACFCPRNRALHFSPVLLVLLLLVIFRPSHLHSSCLLPFLHSFNLTVNNCPPVKHKIAWSGSSALDTCETLVHLSDLQFISLLPYLPGYSAAPTLSHMPTSPTPSLLPPKLPASLLLYCTSTPFSLYSWNQAPKPSSFTSSSDLICPLSFRQRKCPRISL